MNKLLPIWKAKEEICCSINENAVTIIVAETGTGKSTQVPQFLLEQGKKVIVTEPRRLITRTLAERVSEEMCTEVGTIVGYRTGYESRYSEETQLLLCTDGLPLVRKFTDQSLYGVLVIDEVHEFDESIEMLIAWSKKRISENWFTKVVLMSATIDALSLKNYFGGNTKVINVPGQMYNVEFRTANSNIIKVIKELVNEQKNILVFVQGKSEIYDIIESLQGINAVVLPLHGEVDIEDQRKCYCNYSIPKVIVSTNIAQTSVTIPGINAVVDSGKEKRKETHNGIQGLYTHDISQADCLQRMGRAGRTEEGIYVLCSDLSFELREEFPTPEILRCILDQVVLRLLAIGIDAAELEFYHQPKLSHIIIAKEVLTNLGAIKNNKITDIGLQMAKMPISARNARMIIEADRLGVTDSIIIIAAILEVGSLLTRDCNYSEYTLERESDLMAELDIWNRICNKRFINFEEEGINKKAYFKVKELIQKLFESLDGTVRFGCTGNRQAIRRAIISGMVDHLYMSQGDSYINGDDVRRQLDRKSCTLHPQWLVGNPITIEFKDQWGDMIPLDLVCMATKVEIEEMLEIAPQLFEIIGGIDPQYSYSNDCCMSTTEVVYKGKTIMKKLVNTPDHPDAERVKKEWQVSNLEYDKEIERQKVVVVDETFFIINYDYTGKNPSIAIDRVFLFNTKTNVVKLDNGACVNIYYSLYTSNNFPALRSNVENSRIANCWKAVQSNLPTEASIKKDVIIGWLKTVGKILITKKDNNCGEEIYGFIHLMLLDKKIRLCLSDNEEEAEKNTHEALRYIFGKEIQHNYSEKRFALKKDGKVIYTKNGKEAEALFKEYVKIASEQLTAQNFEETMQYLDQVFLEIVKDIQIN